MSSDGSHLGGADLEFAPRDPPADPGAFTHGDSLLPTRWDALGGPAIDALEIGAPALDAPLLEPPTFEPLVTAEGPTSLYDDVYRVCFRLTGLREPSHELASAALRTPEQPGGPGGTVGTAMLAAVDVAIAHDFDDERSVPYYQHRARLRRDLARHTPRDRAILALRHLVGVPPVAVAARLGLHEGVVREVASAWRPEDSRGDSSALLRGIDSWITAGTGQEQATAGNDLAHLDDAD